MAVASMGVVGSSMKQQVQPKSVFVRKDGMERDVTYRIGQFQYVQTIVLEMDSAEMGHAFVRNPTLVKTAVTKFALRSVALTVGVLMDDAVAMPVGMALGASSRFVQEIATATANA
jgi:hypothetical protein